MARRRTSLTLAVLALATAACGQASSGGGGETHGSGRPQLQAVQQQPLMLKATGFRPLERVEVAAKGLRSEHVSAQADSSGEFSVTFTSLKSCDSITVEAVGAAGSRASLNLSSIACVDS